MFRSFLFVISALVVFSVPALLIPPDDMTEILSAGLFIACLFGIWRWGPAAVRAIMDGAKTRESWGIIAIVGLLSALAMQRVYSVVFINLERPVWMTTLHISPFITYLMMIAVVLFISATTFPGEKPTKLGGVAAAFIAFVGVVASHLGPSLLGKVGGLWQAFLSAVGTILR
jgi:hypothetical protein